MAVVCELTALDNLETEAKVRGVDASETRLNRRETRDKVKVHSKMAETVEKRAEARE